MSEEEKKENESGDVSLREGLDLDEWEAAAPAVDFAERVLARVRAEAGEAPVSRISSETAVTRNRGRARRWGIAGGVAGSIALAAAVLLKINTPEAHGEAIAKDRIEVQIGSRAKAVLEAGAQVKWNGDDVVQAHGDVFYRVEPGARFRVHTPAGDVEVKGTCFAVKIRGESKDVEVADMDKRDVKSGVIGAALSALAFVAVYEGKVAVSHAGERVDLGAGESAQTGAGGMSKSASLGDGQKVFDAKAAEAAQASGESSTDSANKNLVAQVSEYRQRLEAIVAQKSELEAKLKKSEEKLATADGGAPKKGEFDLSQEDWAELAKKGTVAYRVPCDRRGDAWTPSPEQMANNGLSPSDIPTLKDAYAKSSKRVWAQIGPLCSAALGGNAELAEKLGTSTCQHLIYDIEMAKDKDAAAEAMTQVAEMRAGLRPEPKAGEKTSPVTQMFLALTGANKAFENDLAASLGPEEAHRLAHASDMCNSDSRWGGGKKREPEGSKP